jgi:hypothetical protein
MVTKAHLNDLSAIKSSFHIKDHNARAGQHAAQFLVFV